MVAAAAFAWTWLWSSGAAAAAADERGDREETLDGEVASRGLGTSGVVPF